MNDDPTPPTTPSDAAPKASRPKRARTLRSSAPTTAPDATTAPPTRPDFAARFRSAGTTPGHTCPNGHGATAPVEPGHTWCAQCGRHYTVSATA